MTSKAKWREERNAEIIRLAKLGVSTSRIARIMHVSTTVVGNVRKQANLTSRSAPLTEEQKERAHRLLQDGASRREAARTIGCSEGKLRRIFPDLAWTAEQNRIALQERQRPHPVSRIRRPSQEVR